MHFKSIIFFFYYFRYTFRKIGSDPSVKNVTFFFNEGFPKVHWLNIPVICACIMFIETKISWYNLIIWFKTLPSWLMSGWCYWWSFQRHPYSASWWIYTWWCRCRSWGSRRWRGRDGIAPQPHPAKAARADPPGKSEYFVERNSWLEKNVLKTLEPHNICLALLHLLQGPGAVYMLCNASNKMNHTIFHLSLWQNNLIRGQVRF